MTTTDRDVRYTPEQIERQRLWQAQQNKPLSSPEREAYFEYTNGEWAESKRKEREG